MRLYAHDGWPLETIRNKPIVNFIRRCLLTDWLLTYRRWRIERNQHTFCYCKNCMNELCADPATACYDAGSEVHYICGKCNWQTDFMFDAPVPIYLRCYPPDEGQGKPKDRTITNPSFTVSTGALPDGTPSFTEQRWGKTGEVDLSKQGKTEGK